MSNQKLACIILLILIAGLVFGTQKTRNRTLVAKNADLAAQSEAENAELQRRITEANLNTLEKKTAELRQVFREWLPHFQTFQTPQSGEQRISDLVLKGGVFVLSQRFEVTNPDETAAVRSVLVADLVFEDDYAKTLNWLGQLEEAVPNCRVTKCRLTRGERGNAVHLELKLEIPILNPAIGASDANPIAQS
jgi:hypothetical protein